MKKLELTSEQKLNRISQQCDFMLGSDLSFDGDDNIAEIKGSNGCRTIAVAVKSKSDGNLEVHFIDAWNADGTARWYVMTLIGGAMPDAGMIDYVRSTNSTVTLTDVEFIL